MGYKYNLFWDPQGEETRQNILNKKDEIIELRTNAIIETMNMLQDIPKDINDISNIKANVKHRVDECSDVNIINNHEPIWRSLGNKIDLTPSLKKIAHSSVEKHMLIIIDEYNGIIVDDYVTNDGLASLINTGDNKKRNINIINYLSKYADKNDLYGIIDIHVHPYDIVALPSNADKRMFYKSMFFYEMFNLKPLDFMVLTDCDLYSQRQYDNKQIKNEDTLFYRDTKANADNFKFLITTQPGIFEYRK